MADSSVQVEIANWIRKQWLPSNFGQSFLKEPVLLSSGGTYTFDAISTVESIAVAVSTSSARTASGRNAIGKMQKIRADMYFLLLANVRQRIVVLTETEMLAMCEKEVDRGRVPRSIEFVFAEIPSELAQRLTEARSIASNEVSPQQRDI
jgi:hypothetical protein